MDVLGCVASVTQLAAYGHVAARQLMLLYKAAQEGPAFCRTQRINIEFLLQIIHRICTEEAQEFEVILPLLIATADLANSLLRLLQQKGTLQNYYSWLSNRQEIEKGFCALNDKTRLLQLHIAERTYRIVTRVQKVRDMSPRLKRRVSYVDQSPPPTSSQALVQRQAQNKPEPDQVGQNGNSDPSEPHPVGQGSGKITMGQNELKEAQQEMCNGWPNSAEVFMKDNKLESSQQAIGNSGACPGFEWRTGNSKS